MADGANSAACVDEVGHASGWKIAISREYTRFPVLSQRIELLSTFSLLPG
jgi:hypothetical protein